MIDATTGVHLWADRFDGLLQDVFELQDKVAISVAGVIAPAVEAAEICRSASRPTNDLTAYDFYLRALAHALSYEKERLVQALGLLGRAIGRDPRFGPAFALAATCRSQLEINDWAGDPITNRCEAVDLARQALRLAADDPDVLAMAGFVLGRFGEGVDAAISLIDRSLALSPSSSRSWHYSGYLRLFIGQLDLAIEHFTTSLRLSPRDPMRGRRLTGIGMAHFLCRRFDDAEANLLPSLEEFPNYAASYRFLASCYAHLGRLDEAREIVKRLRAITPVVVPSASWLRNAEQRELFLSGLRLAAGETT